MKSVSIALLVVGLVLAGADRYGDYTGVGMPQYSMEEGSRDVMPPAEDYLERSPDAPLPFDYKYEEELREKENKLPIKTEAESWHNQSKKLKQPTISPDDDELQKHYDPSVEKPFASRKNRRHRTRIKNNELHREKINFKEKAVPKFRNRKTFKDYIKDDNKDDIRIRNDYYANNGLKRQDNSIESEEISFRDTTEKIIRRKPRDRRINLRRMDVDDGGDDDDDLKTLERDDVKHLVRDDDSEYSNNPRPNSRRFMIERPPQPIPEKTKLRNKNYPEYDDDYYDLKRVNDMKNKMPDLLRRTQASTMETLMTRPVQDFTYRRGNLPETTTEPSTTSSTTTETTTVTKATVTVTGPLKSVSNSTELSLAEKSRLSILKKAQRKDDVKNVTWTTKPPVLMQVTKRMQTLVMVEPPQDVRLRAREVVDDSPERIARAKKLMRRKLVAGARSVHDLTDNWDEMICDYIDVSLLDGSTSIRPNVEWLSLSLICLNWSSSFYVVDF